jgi:hypothetical protein
MENFTDKDIKDFSDKLIEGYNRVVPDLEVQMFELKIMLN